MLNTPPISEVKTLSLVQLGLDRVIVALRVGHITELAYRAPSLDQLIEETAQRVLGATAAKRLMSAWRNMTSEDRMRALEREIRGALSRLTAMLDHMVIPKLRGAGIVAPCVDYLRFETECCPCLQSLGCYHVYLQAAEDNYIGQLGDCADDCLDDAERKLLTQAQDTLGTVELAKLIAGDAFERCELGCMLNNASRA